MTGGSHTMPVDPRELFKQFFGGADPFGEGGGETLANRYSHTPVPTTTTVAAFPTSVLMRYH